MPTSEAVASIDFLSSIPDEILTASGPLGVVYRLQLGFERAQRDYEDTSYLVGSELHKVIPPLGSSSTEMFDSHPAMVAATQALESARGRMLLGQSEVGGVVFLPAVDNLGEITKRLDSLNRKATKLGTEPTTLTVSEEKLVLSYKYDSEINREGNFEHVFAVLKATTPKVEGFEFLATIVTTEVGNVVKRIPAIAYGIRHNLNFEMGYTDDGKSAAGQALDRIDLSRFHSTGSVCEHCGTFRHRNETFVVYNEATGELKQVGRNCLRDYTGLNNPEKVLKHLEQVFEFMRSLGGSRGERSMNATSAFLLHCAAVMRDQGGYKSGLGHDGAQNLWLRAEKKCDKRTGQPLWIEPTEGDREHAERIQRWVAEWDETSEFATNVKIAIGGMFIDPKLHGYGGAAFVAYEKALGRERQQAAKVTREFIGTVGQRESFELTVTDIKWIEDRYSYDQNTKPLIIFSDAAGNEVKWFASRLPDYGAEVGTTYKVTATVKDHRDHDTFGKSTTITRAKFVATIQEARA